MSPFSPLPPVQKVRSAVRTHPGTTPRAGAIGKEVAVGLDLCVHGVSAVHQSHTSGYFRRTPATVVNRRPNARRAATPHLTRRGITTDHTDRTDQQPSLRNGDVLFWLMSLPAEILSEMQQCHGSHGSHRC